MAKEEPYDRWHLKRPKPGQDECPDHPGLFASDEHGRGKRWLARWRNEQGKQESESFPDGRKTAALKFQRSMKAAVEEGRTPLLYAGRKAKLAVPTITEYVETFLTEHEARASTIETYGYRLRGHVVPYLGHRPITEPLRPDYKRYFVMLKADGVPDSTRSSVKKALSAMLSAALDDPDFGHLMPGNQVRDIPLPQGRRQKVRLYWAHVVALAEEIDPRYEMLIWYGSLQGLRSMEAAGVRTGDMRCRLGVMEVEEQRQDGRAAPLKTKHSYAVLPVGSFLVDKYLAHMARWRGPLSAAALRKRERRGLTPINPEYAHLVTLSRYWTPVHENGLCRAFNLAKEKARAKGVMVPEAATFRDLRHFMNSVLFASGVVVRDVQKRMRHGTQHETEDTYGVGMEVDWENAPASFEELYGFPAPSVVPEAALVTQAERELARAGLLFQAPAGGVAPAAAQR
ncbi:hypothetical protein ACFYPC_09685 [Streptomyces sp. NPDC005808]|uniref:hypothetical protein n=1 Tax=Streptomyces sp. NPDC005808 TaxID=3364734 RepID=UPI00367A9D08